MDNCRCKEPGAVYTITMTLTKELQEKNLIELLGLENTPAETQAQITDMAAEIIDLRSLERALDQLAEGDRENFVTLIENKDIAGATSLLKEKGVDLASIVNEEIQRFKEESMKEITT